jgi:hypothetical protein
VRVFRAVGELGKKWLSAQYLAGCPNGTCACLLGSV